MTYIEKAKDKDYEELIEMANISFTKPDDQKNFKLSLPKYYTYDHHHIEEHYVIRSNNQIVATLGAFDNEYFVNDTVLKVRGLGTMGVLPKARQNGYMSKLMKKAEEDIIQDGIDLAFLSGRRQRYENFSFSPSGVALKIKITLHNLKHSVSKSNQYVFKEVNKEDKEILELMNKLYTKKSIRPYRQKEYFYDIILSWYFKPIAFFKDDVFMGYLLHDKDFNISEIECLNNTYLLSVLLDFFNTFNLNKTTITPLPIFEKEKISILTGIAQNTDLITNDNMNVVNYQKVMSAFFKVKADLQPLSDGKIIIDIQNRQKLSIEVKNNHVTINETSDTANITLTHFEAMQLIFSPTSSLLYRNDLPHFIYNWFPLPLFFPRPDNA